MSEDPHGLDMALVEEWMEGLGRPGPFRVTRLGDGRSNLTYLLSPPDSQ